MALWWGRGGAYKRGTTIAVKTTSNINYQHLLKLSDIHDILNVVPLN
jgi:hypothetical protein